MKDLAHTKKMYEELNLVNALEVSAAAKTFPETYSDHYFHIAYFILNTFR